MSDKSDIDTIAVTFADIEYPILCGICSEPVRIRTESGDNFVNADSPIWGCSYCGSSASVYQICLDVEQFYNSEIAGLIQSDLTKAVRMTNVVKFKANRIQKRDHAFVIGLNS